VNQDDHRALRESLGAFALGHLPDDDAATLRAHLDQCADCRTELAEIEPVVLPLASVDSTRLDQEPAPPPWLGDQIVRQALEHDRGAARTRYGRYAALAAAAALVVLAGGIGYLMGTPDVPREPVAVRAMDPDVQASATVIPHTWGVEITLDANGFRDDAVYRVVVRDDTGRTVNAGEFIGTGPARMVCNLNSSILRPQAAGFDVLDAAGDVVVHGDL
jgi:hypothetical protein